MSRRQDEFQKALAHKDPDDPYAYDLNDSFHIDKRGRPYATVYNTTRSGGGYWEHVYLNQARTALALFKHVRQIMHYDENPKYSERVVCLYHNNSEARVTLPDPLGDCYVEHSLGEADLYVRTFKRVVKALEGRERELDRLCGERHGAASHG